jgi:hypothetical protein
MTNLPFSPYSDTLRDVLLNKYIKRVAKWLLGKDSSEILAQHTDSAWETALSTIFLIEVSNIKELKDQDNLQKEIQFKCIAATRWLLDKKITDSDFTFWDGVTWDTSVVIRSLVTCLKKYSNKFTKDEQEEIENVISSGLSWLCYKFNRWEAEVKYPFGPADIAQIVNTLICVAKEYPHFFKKALTKDSRTITLIDQIFDIIEYLLNCKTEQTLRVKISIDLDETIVTYWWDDYFSTSEVVESLARFYGFYTEEVENQQLDDSIKKKHGKLAASIKKVLIGACAYFEQKQVDGMWGSHIDTLKVIHAYVLIRRMFPQKSQPYDEEFIVPEIHTTFKALRWICDEKQIFSNGSFLHTMFLTIFYAQAILEIHRSWEPAEYRIDRLYDDVVWFSPVRTTPERSKRLAQELRNSDLSDSLSEQKRRYKHLQSKFINTTIFLIKINVTIVSFFLLIVPFFIFLGNYFNLLKISPTILDIGNLFQFSSVFFTIALAIIAVIWNYDRIFNQTKY